MAPPKQIFPPSVDGGNYRTPLVEELEPLARLASWIYNNVDMEDETRVELLGEYAILRGTSKSWHRYDNAYDRIVVASARSNDIVSFACMVGYSGPLLAPAEKVGGR